MIESLSALIYNMILIKKKREHTHKYQLRIKQ